MAWRSHGKTNVELISNMARNGIIEADRVINAMKRVDRANYVLDKSKAYEDRPQSIRYDATISAPHMHAYASEHLLPYIKPGARILDVGSGSGYLTAVLYHLASEDPSRPGKVVGIEHVPELVQFSEENLKKDGLGDALESKAIEVIVGDGRQGYAAGGPYHAIHVGAAAPELPQPLVDQLASPGRMFIPVGVDAQYIMHVDKDENGKVTQSQVMPVQYVPLTGRPAVSP
ncbi:protein-L-isoaspartate O-methyltransferase [Schizophyllum commune]